MKQNQSRFRASMKDKAAHLDWKLLLTFLVLLIFGIIMVYSSSSYFAKTVYNNSEFFLRRQAIFAVPSVVGVGILTVLNNKIIRNPYLIMSGAFFTLILLIALSVVSFLTGGESATNGAAAWLNVGGLGVQPAELAKVVLILYLAVFISNQERSLSFIGYKQESPEMKTSYLLGWKQVFKTMKKPLVLIAAFLFFIMIQPDMGGVLIIGGICFVMILLSGIPFRYGLTAVGFGAAFYAVFIGFMQLFGSMPFLPTYMSERFTAFLDPFKDVKDSSFQLVNSFYALSRGGIFGVGLGQSVQKSGYLPESYTDFIISITAEELGLIGVTVVILLLFFLVYRIYKISLEVRDPFGQMVCIGVATMFLIQGTINVGGAIGVLPLTGVTFPFLSYGGSSLLINSAAIGLVSNISLNERLKRSTEATSSSRNAE